MVKTVKAHVVNWVALGVIVSMIAVIASLATAKLTAIYNLKQNAQSNARIECTFNTTTSAYATGTMTPIKGALNYGFVQTSGNTGNTYKFYYKKSSASSYTLVRKYTPTKNNTYAGAYYLLNANGSTKYAFKIQRTAGSKAAKMNVDLLVL